MQIKISVAKTAYSAEAINRAAYKVAQLGSAQISDSESEWIIHLFPQSNVESEALRHEFLANLSDESLREIIRARTDPLRSLILAHAYSNTRLTGEDASTEG
jgi:His-Xaa-Ser system protein HxsD